ncbi:MAG TPA: Gfo/Idh/MocA family oxidoreductase [Candidatus Dormibacteraeota bacterium]|nr:Gfo/Idh/MocA family oxidoreductase [Candidatus Dormibacteraeota bacterium]
MTGPATPTSDAARRDVAAPAGTRRQASRVGVAVVGYGYWGPNLVRNFAEVPEAQVVGVSDLRRGRLETVAARYPAVRATTDHRDLLADPAVDAVVIATPVATHYDLARQALEAGKHVLVEKPMATSCAEAAGLIELAERRGLVLMVDHTFVYTGAVRKIKELVDAGELGRLYYWDSTRVNLGLFQHDVSVLVDLAVHDLSIMDYVLGGGPDAVSATGMAHVPGSPVNTAYLTCFFDGDLLAHFHVNWLAPVKVRRTLIGGDRRMVVFDDIEPSEKVKVYDRGITLAAGEQGRFEMLVGYRAGDMWAPRLSLTEALRIEAQHFVDCIQEGRRPVTDGHAGYRVVRILEAAAASLAQRGRLIELDWENRRAHSTHRPAGAVPEPQAAD